MHGSISAGVVGLPRLSGTRYRICGGNEGPADSVGTVDMRAALNDKAHLEQGGNSRAGGALARAGPVRENGGAKVVATPIYTAGVDQGVRDELGGPEAQVAHEAVYCERGPVAFALCLENLRHYAAFLLCNAWTARESSASSLKTLHSPALLADSISFIRESRP